MANVKGFKELCEENQISYLDGFMFVFHYKWVSEILRWSVTLAGKWQPILKLILYVLYYMMAWVPLCLFLRFGTFIVAIGWRIVSSKGGREGLQTSLLIMGSYIFLIWTVYIPFILPHFGGYTTLDSILETLKVI